MKIDTATRQREQESWHQEHQGCQLGRPREPPPHPGRRCGRSMPTSLPTRNDPANAAGVAKMIHTKPQSTDVAVASDSPVDQTQARPTITAA